MMNTRLATLVVFAIAIGLVGNAYAHKDQVIGDYKIGVGWAKEPPKVGKANAIEVSITKASTSDKKSATTHSHGDHSNSDMKKTTKKATIKKTSADTGHMDMKTTKSTSKPTAKAATKSSSKGVSGLADTLQVDVTLNGKKTQLVMKESKKTPGVYTGDYTPDSVGYPTVHLYAKINGKDIEGTFHPEKVTK
jgi:hypothetical protein